jgi:hypothetical protein
LPFATFWPLILSFFPFAFSPMVSRQELIEILESNVNDTDLMVTVIQEYVLNLNDDKLAELEDFLVDNFCG